MPGRDGDTALTPTPGRQEAAGRRHILNLRAIWAIHFFPTQKSKNHHHQNRIRCGQNNWRMSMSKFWPLGHATAQDSCEWGSRYCRFNVVSKGWVPIVRGPWDSANDNSVLNLSAAQGCKVDRIHGRGTDCHQLMWAEGYWGVPSAMGLEMEKESNMVGV